MTGAGWWIFVWLAVASLATASTKVDEARAELREGHADAAIALLREELAKDPAAEEARTLLADVLIVEERFEEGGEVIERGLAKSPSSAGLHRAAGDLHYREGHILDADKEYRAAIKLDDKNARAIYGASRVFEAGCLREKAATLLRMAHALDPRDPVIGHAFDRSDRYSASAVTRLEGELARAQADRHSERVRTLEAWIAEGKALGGKPEMALASPYQHYQIPLTRLMDGRRITGVGVAVKIKNAKTELRLDTGAPGLLVSSRFAEHAGLERLADTEIMGVGNDPALKGWIGYAPRLQIGDVEFTNCIVRVTGKGSADESGGLIGTDVFRRFLVRINFGAQRIELAPLPGPAWDGQTPVNRYEGPELAGFAQMLIIRHYLLMPTMITETSKAEQTPSLFLIDTGARMNMISTSLAPDVTRVRDSSVRVRGISGKVKMVYEADKVVLQFAGFRQVNLGLLSFDLTGVSRSAGTEISGTMGLPLIGLFQSVTLDYRDGRVKFEYKP